MLFDYHKLWHLSFSSSRCGSLEFESGKLVHYETFALSQIDMVDMEGSDYGERCYNKMLVVTDLYSRYVFGRALADTTDQSLIVRHLMDIFGAFGPPGKHLYFVVFYYLCFDKNAFLIKWGLLYLFDL